jgi:putative endonuclease
MNDQANDRPAGKPARTLKPRSVPRPAGERVPQPERQVAFRLGISAESRAAAYLIAKGFRILARRWRSPVGEIDIIARRRQLLVFVEVKAREKLEDAAWSVTDRQRARIVAAAEAWLSHQGDHDFKDMRFDAVLVAPGRIPQHIPAAFDAGG